MKIYLIRRIRPFIQFILPHCPAQPTFLHLLMINSSRPLSPTSLRRQFLSLRSSHSLFQSQYKTLLLNLSAMESELKVEKEAKKKLKLELKKLETRQELYQSSVNQMQNRLLDMKHGQLIKKAFGAVPGSTTTGGAVLNNNEIHIPAPTSVRRSSSGSLGASIGSLGASIGSSTSAPTSTSVSPAHHHRLLQVVKSPVQSGTKHKQQQQKKSKKHEIDAPAHTRQLSDGATSTTHSAGFDEISLSGSSDSILPLGNQRRYSLASNTEILCSSANHSNASTPSHMNSTITNTSHRRSSSSISLAESPNAVIDLNCNESTHSPNESMFSHITIEQPTQRSEHSGREKDENGVELEVKTVNEDHLDALSVGSISESLPESVKVKSNSPLSSTLPSSSPSSVGNNNNSGTGTGSTSASVLPRSTTVTHRVRPNSAATSATTGVSTSGIPIRSTSNNNSNNVSSTSTSIPRISATTGSPRTTSKRFGTKSSASASSERKKMSHRTPDLPPRRSSINSSMPNPSFSLNHNRSSSNS